jgi:hypothetical protein
LQHLNCTFQGGVYLQGSGRDPVGLTIGRQSLGKTAVAVALIALVV